MITIDMVTSVIHIQHYLQQQIDLQPTWHGLIAYYLNK